MVIFTDYAQSHYFSSIIQLSKICSLEFLNNLVIVVQLKEYLVEIQPSISRITNPFPTINYLEGNFYENVNISKSKFKRAIFELCI